MQQSNRRNWIARVAGLLLSPLLGSCALDEVNRTAHAGSLQRLSGLSSAPMLAAAIDNVMAWFALDARTGQLQERQTLALDAAIQYAVPHPHGELLYLVTSDADTPGRKGPPRHALVTLRRDKRSGEWSRTGLPRSLPAFANHITINPTGRFLLLACHAPSMLLAIAVDAAGMPGDMVAQFDAQVVGPFAHQAALPPAGNAVVVCARGNDAGGERPEEHGALTVFDWGKNRLTPRATHVMSAGLGPRNLAWHPAGRWIYVAMERGNMLATMRWTVVELDASPLALVSTLANPATLRPRQRAGALRVHPNGRSLYVANRADRIERDKPSGISTFLGGENNIAVFALNPVSGLPTLVQHIDTQGIEPRSMTIDPTGTLLIVGNQIAFDGMVNGTAQRVPASVMVFSIQPNGLLQALHRHAIPGNGLRWLEVIESSATA